MAACNGSTKVSKAGARNCRCAELDLFTGLGGEICEFLEELIECPMALLSASPERDDTILMRDPF